MGTYRLILALLVLLSHVEMGINGYNPGVIAVISFFLLSGFVMTALIKRNYDRKDRILYFYLDRALRLFPQFLLYLFLTLILVLSADIKGPFLDDLNAFKIFLNTLMLPLGFYMYGLEHAVLIPQAWSLGLELTFYILIPLILIYKLEYASIFFSVFIFTLAYLGYIHTDHFGYRLIPGTLFIFLCGSLLYSAPNKVRYSILTFVYGYVFILFTALLRSQAEPVPYNTEVLAGFLIGLPVVVMLKNITPWKYDALLGNLSYGVFLNHFSLIYLFEFLGLNTKNYFTVIVLALVSMLLAWISFILVERPAIGLRKYFRSADPKKTRPF